MSGPSTRMGASSPEGGRAPNPKGAGVVMLTAGFHPQLGGAERQALELSRALVAAGEGVRVITRRLPGLPSEDLVDGVPVLRLAAWGGGLTGSAVFLAASFLHLLLRARGHRAIHVHLAGSPAVAAALAGRLTGKPVVVKVGGGRGIGEVAVSSRTLAGRLKLALLRFLRPRLVAVCADLLEELRIQGLDDGAVVIHNGVDLDRYRPTPPEERLRLRRSLGWPDGPVLLYAGRLSPEKRLVEFLGVFAEGVRGRPEGPVLVLAGDGPREGELRAAVERLGLSSRVRLLPATPDVRGLYAAADAFVLPSLSEGLSNSLLEAMASGLAVLASRVGGTREAVEDGRSGLLFDPLDGEQAREKLGRLLDEPGLAARLGARAREAAESFSMTETVRKYRELYDAG